MKIEVGWTYRTRGGRKAVAMEDDGTDFYPVAVSIGDDAYWYNSDGSHLTGRQTIDDLIEEWVEVAPVTEISTPHIVAVTINGQSGAGYQAVHPLEP